MGRYTDRSINIDEFIPERDDDLIICRCEEITKGEIRKAVHLGMWTVTEVKRFSRAGMGLCQGQTCAQHVKSIIARELKISVSELSDDTPRPPMRPVEMQVLGNEADAK